MTRETLRQYEHLLSELEEEQLRLARQRRHAKLAAETLGAYSLFGDDGLAELERLVLEHTARHGKELADIRLWIETIRDSQTRRAFKLRYVDGRSWSDVSRIMGYTDESGARKICERYLSGIAG